jgi:hypothetical protein
VLVAAHEHCNASGIRKDSVIKPELHWSAYLRQQENTAQDAQKDLTSHPPNPGAPRRAVPRARPQERKVEAHASVH